MKKSKPTCVHIENTEGNFRGKTYTRDIHIRRTHVLRAQSCKQHFICVEISQIASINPTKALFHVSTILGTLANLYLFICSYLSNRSSL